SSGASVVSSPARGAEPSAGTYSNSTSVGWLLLFVMSSAVKNVVAPCTRPTIGRSTEKPPAALPTARRWTGCGSVVATMSEKRIAFIGVSSQRLQVLDEVVLLRVAHADRE